MTRASFEEVLDFCNRVREAGGGDPIDALMPAIPRNSNACLLARNLNFDCSVRHLGNENWVMYVNDPDVAVNIANALELSLSWSGRGVRLPKKIGLVARDFDCVLPIVDSVYSHVSQTISSHCVHNLSTNDKKLLREMYPYISPESVHKAPLRLILEALNDKS